MSLSASTYNVRACLGHYHVTCGPEEWDLIGGRFETKDEAEHYADLLNQGASVDDVLGPTPIEPRYTLPEARKLIADELEERYPDGGYPAATQTKAGAFECHGLRTAPQLYGRQG